MTLTLHNRMIPKFSSQARLLLLMAMLTMAVIACIVAILLEATKQDFSYGLIRELLAKVLHAMVEKPEKALEFAVYLVALPAYLWYTARAYGGERLIMDDAGIRYESPLPSIVKFLKPDWSLPWARVRRLLFTTSGTRQDIRTVRLVLDAGQVTRKLNPWLWIDRSTYKPATPGSVFRQLFRAAPTAQQIREEALATPLMTWLADAQPRLCNDMPENGETLAFALEKNPVSLTVVVAFFVFVAYGLGDTLFNDESYVAAPDYAFYIEAGAIAALLCLFALRGARVPWAETIMVGLLTGAALGCALYPGLLRINQFTDTQGLREYPYLLQDHRHFKPVQSGLPEIDITTGEEYWRQFKPGTRCLFRLRRGGLGFYQIDMAPLYAAYRAFYVDGAKEQGSEKKMKTEQSIFLTSEK